MQVQRSAGASQPTSGAGRPLAFGSLVWPRARPAAGSPPGTRVTIQCLPTEPSAPELGDSRPGQPSECRPNCSPVLPTSDWPPLECQLAASHVTQTSRALLASTYVYLARTSARPPARLPRPLGGERGPIRLASRCLRWASARAPVPPSARPSARWVPIRPLTWPLLRSSRANVAKGKRAARATNRLTTIGTSEEPDCRWLARARRPAGGQHSATIAHTSSRQWGERESQSQSQRESESERQSRDQPAARSGHR